MTPRQNLGELEQLVLLACLRLGEDATGAAIRRELSERADRSVGPGTLYPTLERLESKGHLRSRLGEPTPARGGRAKRHFTLTEEGVREVRRAWREVAGLARGMEHVLAPRRSG